MEDHLDTVKFSKLKKVINSLEEHPITKDRLEDLEVSFEFIIGSLFPDILENIKDKITNSYIEGYLAAKQEMENNNANQVS